MTGRTYPAVVERVIDGDTVQLNVDLGFCVWCLQTFRLLGINAREHDMPGGPEATENLRAILAQPDVLTITSVKPDKFGGRYDAAITLPDGRDLATLLVADNWAAAWDGRGTKPLPPWPRP